MKKYNSRIDTLAHINVVRGNIEDFVYELRMRSLAHDKSKLSSIEKATFDEFTPKLKNSTYGSDEYKGFLKAMKPALDHHYANNPHHPEHFYTGDDPADVIFERMGLVDIVEMLLDWKAASTRHTDGDIKKSILLNQVRFGYSDTWVKIFNNTIDQMEE